MFRNPEFIRNTWTELTAKKLAATRPEANRMVENSPAMGSRASAASAASDTCTPAG